MRFNAEMWEKAFAAAGGFLIGVLLFAVGREVVLAFAENPPAIVLPAVFHWLGTFRWLYDYQTIIALIGAWWAAQAVYNQIRQAERFAKNQAATRRAVASATLPLALTELSDYAHRCIDDLILVHNACVSGSLPSAAVVNPFASIPVAAVAQIREMIEAADEAERVFLSTLLASLQVQHSRLAGLVRDHVRASHIVLTLNIERYILDAGDIYARTASMYRFARGIENRIPGSIRKIEIANSLSVCGVVPPIYDTILQNYDLNSQEEWVSPFRAV
ncbi:hypothetical protein [Rhizobium beringeri]|jgi:hypothetical protein|uniref:hypothetical protein n=1 Tax=Rhizobium beringeri TaxID=3019934 RepID=UPI002E162B03|nr:hypothetical protein U8P75_22420 [Rhizobium beringeri]WSH79923.1 hypothetical protein U8P69_22250 [Rhizobium beringeri]